MLFFVLYVKAAEGRTHGREGGEHRVFCLAPT